jgi:hypothetical protein
MLAAAVEDTADWNVDTTVEPQANVSGSTSVACAAVGALSGGNGSELIWNTPGCAACAGGRGERDAQHHAEQRRAPSRLAREAEPRRGRALLIDMDTP